MYGLFTRMGAGAVLSAGLSVLGVTYLCTDGASNHHPPTVAAVEADAALGAAVVASPPSYGSSGHPANGNAGNGSTVSGNAGLTTNLSANLSAGSNPNSGSNTGPGSSTTPGSNHSEPDCGCAAGNSSLVTVKPDVDADVDVVVTLPDTDAAPGLVGGVLGTVGAVVTGVVPDCGCSDSPAVLALPVLGH